MARLEVAFWYCDDREVRMVYVVNPSMWEEGAMARSLTPQEIAQAFHASYERQAPAFGYETRDASAKPWSEVPEQNRGLMVAVARDLMARGIIAPGVIDE